MKHHPHLKKTTALYTIGVVGFFSALHASLPTYFNSSFLSSFVDEKTVSLIYLIISLITIVGFLSMHTILHKLGNLKTSLLLISIQIAVFYGLITATSIDVIIPLFILAMSIVSLIALTIDIFLQKNTEAGHTGSVRGIFMTVINTAWILGPLIGGMLIIENDYKGVYIGAFALLLPLFYLVYKNFSNFKDSHYANFSAVQTISRIIKNRDISSIFIINIVLQTFYAWMTVYTPIYLHNTIGFDWKEISIIFTIMLIPFVIVDAPLGKLADKKWGEKEMLIIGFVIMGISTGALVFFGFKSFMAWAIMLFMTRVGAAIAEVMIETYFFKKVDGKGPEVLSMFRITRPLSFFIAPLITTIGLVYMTENYLFVVLGVLCLLTLFPIFKIKDTN
jgi:predicted MFS family arabinose efflux permease